MVGTVHRPPYRNFSMFLKKFNDIFSKISKDNKQFFTWWAILISIHPRSTITTCLRRNSLLACSLTRSFHQFFYPTRLTSYSATLLDNIFTTHLPKDVYSGIILNYRSDHFPVFAYFHDEHMPPTGGKTVFKRSLNERNFNKSTELLSRKNWSGRFLMRKTPMNLMTLYMNLPDDR